MYVFFSVYFSVPFEGGKKTNKSICRKTKWKEGESHVVHPIMVYTSGVRDRWDFSWKNLAEISETFPVGVIIRLQLSRGVNLNIGRVRDYPKIKINGPHLHFHSRSWDV